MDCQHLVIDHGVHEDHRLDTYKKLHFRYLLVYLFHKLDNEIHQLMLQHFLCVEIGDEERDVVPLNNLSR